MDSKFLLNHSYGIFNKDHGIFEPEFTQIDQTGFTDNQGEGDNQHYWVKIVRSKAVSDGDSAREMFNTHY